MNDRQRPPPATPGAVGTAFAGGMNLAWTAILFVAVRRLLPQKPLANAPPVVVILSVAAAGTVLGIGGLLRAAPITVLAFVGGAEALRPADPGQPG